MASVSEPFRPASAVNHAAALTSLFGALAVLGAFKWWGSQDAAYCLVAVTVSVALPHVGLFLLSWENSPPQLGQRQHQWQRLAIKLLGQLGLFAALALAYFVFQGFYQNYLLPISDFGRELVLVVAVATPLYLWVTDRRMEHPEDGLYQIGQLLLGKFHLVNIGTIRQYLLGWIVKGFFGPLMAGFALNDMHWFLDFSISSLSHSASDIYQAAYRMVYFIDVIFALTGYLCTFRLMNAQIRSTEPTMSGWVVCLLCYPPFWDVFSNNFFAFEEGYYWSDWLADSPRLWLFWAALIIFSTTIYTWATVSFGIRFSNLTNRGILTNGPYRWMKHPAYVAKNISWWLIAVPFLSNVDYGTIIRSCAALALLNGVYYLRAKTEERHLSSDPDYVAYCMWMETNSLYGKIKNQLLRLTQAAT